MRGARTRHVRWDYRRGPGGPLTHTGCTYVYIYLFIYLYIYLFIYLFICPCVTTPRSATVTGGCGKRPRPGVRRAVKIKTPLRGHRTLHRADDPFPRIIIFIESRRRLHLWYDRVALVQYDKITEIALGFSRYVESSVRILTKNTDVAAAAGRSIVIGVE